MIAILAYHCQVNDVLITRVHHCMWDYHSLYICLKKASFRDFLRSIYSGHNCLNALP